MEYCLSRKRDLLEQLLEQKSVVDHIVEPILTSSRVSSISPNESERLVRMTKGLYQQIPYIVYHSLQQDKDRRKVLINYLGENYEIKVKLK
jgi:hypothetical protein